MDGPQILNRSCEKNIDPVVGSYYCFYMRIISKKILKDFWTVHTDSEQQLKAWHAKTKLASWASPSGIKNDYRNASFVANNRVVFNIKGNKYRLVAAVNYDFGIIYIRFVGTHKEYDKIDVVSM